MFVGVEVNKDTQKENNSWSEKQSQAADANGLALVVRDESGAVVTESNNNSMCRALYGSSEFAPECDKFCGRAFEWAREAGETVGYRCYAGLDCRAVPVKLENKTEFVTIVGRAFTRAENYRAATTRAIDGDWKRFAPNEFFANVLLSGSDANLNAAAKDFENANDEEKAALLAIAAQTGNENKLNEHSKSQAQIETANGEITAANETLQADETSKSTGQFHDAEQETVKVSNRFAQRNSRENEETAAWRSLFGALLDLSYKRACAAILEFLSERYSLQSLAWLERRGERLEIILAGGNLQNREIEFDIAADDERLKDAARRETALELKERDAETENQIVWLFPVAVGGQIRSGLVLGDGETSKKMRRRLARFCRAIAPELEILRLREELSKRGWLERAVRKFNENLKTIDSEDFWLSVAQISAELMRAERCSLLIFDEKTGAFKAKAAIGATADAVKSETETLGARVAARVLESGIPVVVENVERIGVGRAPADWKYKSKSFTSYPIEIGGRKIGVLNFTERADGDAYNEFDLDLLRAIVPQMAVLVDRAALKDKAGEFEQLSVTDALTGLLNRRYLEERLTEEVRRSNRYGFPMSFMMIDVDEFKSYNDTFSHPEGDKALKLVAQYLKETLRGADIAARYGGEEFSILLPQTTADEAAIIAERVRASVDAAQFPNRKVTVSIGVASCSQIVCSPPEIVKAADKALYEAKRMGRNNVQIYEQLRTKN